uniref:Uncharacterized protein n=1 Tax=Anguilla anguilla TaxID=7936 RepID=A0A0E9TVH9_ANGAN
MNIIWLYMQCIQTLAVPSILKYCNTFSILLMHIRSQRNVNRLQ